MMVRTALPSLTALAVVLAAFPACDGDPVAARAPVAVAGGEYTAAEGQPIQFDGTASSDPNGLALTYEWDFGNGATGVGATPVYTYNAAGTYDVKLVVTNDRGKKSAPATARALIEPWVADTLARDDFERDVAGGWGIAPAGGEWLPTLSGRHAFSVANGVGLIVKSDTSMRNAVLSGGYGLDATGLVSFSIDRMPDAAAFYTVQVYARRDDSPAKGEGNHHYRFRVRAHSDGEMDLLVDKTVAGVTTFVDTTNVSIATVWEPGATYWIRWEAQGTSPATNLRMRVWRDGTAEPGDWQLDLVHDEPALDAAGTVGIRVSGPNTGQTTWPVTFTIDNLSYVKIE